VQLRIKGLDQGSLHLRNLRFAFPVLASVEEGVCGLSVAGFTRTVRATNCRLLAPLEVVTLSVPWRARVSLDKVDVASLLEEAPSSRRARNGSQHPGCRDAGHRAFPRKPLTMEVSSAVFFAPHLGWRLASAPSLLSAVAGTKISRGLLQEGESFRQIVMTQRLMRFLFDLSTLGTTRTEGEDYGFPDRCRLENAFHDQFGVSIDLLRSAFSLRRNREGHHQSPFF
jgi:hypothetical protein